MQIGIIWLFIFIFVILSFPSLVLLWLLLAALYWKGVGIIQLLLCWVMFPADLFCLGLLIIKACWILSQTFSGSIEMIMWFLSKSICMNYYIFWLKYVEPTLHWSFWYVCVIQCANIYWGVCIFRVIAV